VDSSFQSRARNVDSLGGRIADCKRIDNFGLRVSVGAGDERRAYFGSRFRVQKLAGSRLLAGDGHEFLDAFAVFDFARVDIPLRVHGD
jgi:hypothetical protein